MDEEKNNGENEKKDRVDEFTDKLTKASNKVADTIFGDGDKKVGQAEYFHYALYIAVTIGILASFAVAFWDITHKNIPESVNNNVAQTQSFDVKNPLVDGDYMILNIVNLNDKSMMLVSGREYGGIVIAVPITVVSSVPADFTYNYSKYYLRVSEGHLGIGMDVK